MTTSLTTMANASDQSLAGFSNTPSETTSESKSHLAEPVKKCIAVLEQAETDTGELSTCFRKPDMSVFCWNCPWHSLKWYQANWPWPTCPNFAHTPQVSEIFDLIYHLPWDYWELKEIIRKEQKHIKRWRCGKPRQSFSCFFLILSLVPLNMLA